MRTDLWPIYKFPFQPSMANNIRSHAQAQLHANSCSEESRTDKGVWMNLRELNCVLSGWDALNKWGCTIPWDIQHRCFLFPSFLSVSHPFPHVSFFPSAICWGQIYLFIFFIFFFSSLTYFCRFLLTLSPFSICLELFKSSPVIMISSSNGCLNM